MLRTVSRPAQASPVERERSAVQIRAIVPSDAVELRRFYAGLSGESRRTRFLGISPGLSEEQSVSFCSPDHDHREGFVATRARASGREQIVGHVCLEPDGAGTAEVAIAVADAVQRRGIGRQLLWAAEAWAERNGVRRFTATMLTSNAAIHRLLTGLGAPTRTRCIGGGVAEIVIELGVQGAAA